MWRVSAQVTWLHHTPPKLRSRRARSRRGVLLRCNTKSTPVISPDLIRCSGSSSQLRSSSGLPPYCVLLSSRLSLLGNVILLFSWSVLIVLCFQTYLRSKIWNPCYTPFLVIISFIPHNCLIIFPFHRYIHSQEYLYKRIMYDRISSYID